jgi:TolB-like protein
LELAFRERYRLVRELGRGGMATVYLAQDLRHERPVALKLLSPAIAGGLGPERFLLEIKVTARLQHPHILPLLDSGVLQASTGQSLPFYVMPYVEGESLRDRLTREHQLPIDQALRIAGDVASALAYAHAQGVIHRDIKPENILLGNDQASVADFGIARAVSLAGGERLTETGLALGTPHYMSPEQATGDRAIDARSDIYALGCVLYEMLAGEPPFTGPTAQSVIAKALSAPAPPIRKTRPAVSQAIEQVVARALAQLPADRYQSAAALSEALTWAAASPATQPTATAAATAWTRRRNLALLTLAMIGLVAALVLRSSRSSAIIAPASSIAVLPFTPSGTDTALSRLGRDLVYTLSAELDGLGGIRVVDAHTVLAHARQERLGTAADWTALGRSFGAGSVVQGSLVRMGPAVRLDLAMFSLDSGGGPLARATVTAPLDSVAALTDTAARALLRQVWSRGSPPTPSLDVALRTRSVAALRSFLQGEGEMTHGDWDHAATSYRQAMEADPTFWPAYARHVFARNWTQLEQNDSTLALLGRHRSELPERERLTTEVILLAEGDSIGAVLEQARTLSERYADSWFGWLIYGDMALHNGPLLGRSIDEGRAFQRALRLNPDLIPVWEHLMLLALVERDTAAAGNALHELGRLNAGPILTADGYGNRMLQFRYLLAIERRDSAAVRALTDSMARDPAPLAIPDGSFYDPLRFGFFAQQVEVSRRTLALGGSPERRQAHRRLLALSWAGLGDWDSALVNLDRVGREDGDSAGALRSYGVAALGVWLGAVDAEQATSRRSAAADRGSLTPDFQAELAWIDGVLAAARRDRQGLAQARAALRQSGDAAAESLERSLAAFDAELRGDLRGAGETMARLEWEQAAVTAPDFVEHPLTLPLDRLAAARWLSAAGQSEEALRLLRWVDGPFLLHPSTVYGLMLRPTVERERKRIGMLKR